MMVDTWKFGRRQYDSDKMSDRLPEFCYVVIPAAEPGKRIGIIKRGESGYYLTDFDSPTADMKIVEQAVAEFNKRLRVTKAQAMAMEVGSMFGWHVPGADPFGYEYLDKETT